MTVYDHSKKTRAPVKYNFSIRNFILSTHISTKGYNLDTTYYLSHKNRRKCTYFQHLPQENKHKKTWQWKKSPQYFIINFEGGPKVHIYNVIIT